MKRLSIIIPGYNTPERFWRRCVKSVIVSCGPNDEVICVDDGSKEIVKKEWLTDKDGKIDYRVRLIRLNRNSGLPTARNTALEESKGEFVTFVDSDDEVLPEVYERSLKTICKYKSDIAIFGVCPVWVSNELCKHDILKEEDLGTMNALQLAKVYKACLFDYACNKIYRRSFLDKNKLRFDPFARTGEDTIFNCNCVLANAKWCTVDYEGMIYYRYDGTMLSRYVPNMRDTHLRKLEARMACRASRPGIDELLGGKIEVSEAILDYMEWKNMWKRQSPYSLYEKWIFLKTHPNMSSQNKAFEFAKALISFLLRRYLYFRFIRRWHVRRLYPNVEEWKEQ